jgi:hypothetical protein
VNRRLSNHDSNVYPTYLAWCLVKVLGSIMSGWAVSGVQPMLALLAGPGVPALPVALVAGLATHCHLQLGGLVSVHSVLVV